MIRVIRFLLVAILALISLPLTILYFALRLFFGSRQPKRYAPSSRAAERIREQARARHFQR